MKRIAIITGASSGLGKEFAKLYAKDNNNLLLVDIDEVALGSVKEELKICFPNILIDTFIADLSKEEDLKKTYNYTLEKEYFVNNFWNCNIYICLDVLL